MYKYQKPRLRLTSRLAINHLKIVNQSSYWHIPILSVLFSVISCLNRIYHFRIFFPLTLSVSTKMKYIRHIYFFYNLHKVLINPSISPFTTPNIIKFPFSRRKYPWCKVYTNKCRSIKTKLSSAANDP